jgi:hypothetical protein
MMKFGKDACVALGTVARVMGACPPEGIESLRRLVALAGLSPSELKGFTHLLEERRDFTGLPALILSGEERVVIYSIATWLARIDGAVMPEQKMTLAHLGGLLRLADGDRTRASAASFQVEQLPVIERPKRYDFFQLVAAVARKLEF